MPISTWIRDILGIRKDMIDTEKSQLEIEKLEAEKRERDLITPASLEDVKRYDPKYNIITSKADKEAYSYEYSIAAGLIVLIIIAIVLWWFKRGMSLF